MSGLEPLRVQRGRDHESVVTRYKLTPAGHFAVHRGAAGECIEIVHVPSQLRVCGLSHLAYRTMKAVIERLAAIERTYAITLGVLKVDHSDRACLLTLKDALREQFADAMG